MRAKKSLGQNFLQDETVIKRIIDALDVRPDETVVEIGPGHGEMTAQLIEKAAAVIAIEFDRDLIASLKNRFSQFESFSVFNEDVLSVDFSRLIAENLGSKISNLKLIANLPYNISTPILQRLIDQRSLFSSFVLMFQREVVERITAAPGGKDRGFLSVMVEDAFDAEYLFDVPPQAFRPVPKVWSAVVRLTPKSARIKDEILFRKILSISFSQKRKNIQNNLKGAYPNASGLLESAGIDSRRRAETLTLNEWGKLLVSIANENDRASI